MRGGRWTVRDLGSTNGTWRNGERVLAAALDLGDLVHFGGIAATVR